MRLNAYSLAKVRPGRAVNERAVNERARGSVNERARAGAVNERLGAFGQDEEGGFDPNPVDPTGGSDYDPTGGSDYDPTGGQESPPVDDGEGAGHVIPGTEAWDQPPPEELPPEELPPVDDGEGAGHVIPGTEGTTGSEPPWEVPEWLKSAATEVKDIALGIAKTYGAKYATQYASCLLGGGDAGQCLTGVKNTAASDATGLANRAKDCAGDATCILEISQIAAKVASGTMTLPEAEREIVAAVGRAKARRTPATPPPGTPPPAVPPTYPPTAPTPQYITTPPLAPTKPAFPWALTFGGVALGAVAGYFFDRQRRPLVAALGAGAGGVSGWLFGAYIAAPPKLTDAQRALVMQSVLSSSGMAPGVAATPAGWLAGRYLL